VSVGNKHNQICSISISLLSPPPFLSLKDGYWW